MIESIVSVEVLVDVVGLDLILMMVDKFLNKFNFVKKVIV